MRESKKRRTQAERSEESSRRMLDAATQLIAEQGFTRTTIPQIAQKAGYSHGLVNRRFGSKSELIRILATEFQSFFALDQLAPALEGRTGLDALIVTIESYIDTIAASGTLGRAYYELFGESVALVPEIHDTFVDADRMLRALVERMIHSAIEADEIPKEVDPSALASLLLAILRGVSMQWVLDSTALDLDAVKAEIRRVLESAFSRSPEKSAESEMRSRSTRKGR